MVVVLEVTETEKSVSKRRRGNSNYSFLVRLTNDSGERTTEKETADGRTDGRTGGTESEGSASRDEKKLLVDVVAGRRFFDNLFD